MALGNYLRELRDARDLSLREFARKIDVTPAFVSDIELGKRHPSEKVLADMARVLGVSVEDLRQRDTRPPVDEIKRLAAGDARYAFAFRSVLDQGVTPDDLLAFAKRLAREDGKKKK